MKQLTLTGLATEQSFTRGGQAKYFLVFNDGKFRVPITEEAAEVVVREMLNDEDDNQPVETDQDEQGYVSEEAPTSSDWDDGVDQV